MNTDPISFTPSLKALFLATFLTTASARQPMLTTITGQLLGIEELVEDRIVHVFQGVPYAEPPTGQRRFMKPVPLMPIPGIFNATRSPPGCLRPSQIDLHMSEDCLYLNLWIPSLQNEAKDNRLTNRPIIIYVPSSDQTGLPDCAELAAANDAIFIAISYRLGALGFLYSASTEAPGNVGLYDVLEAIRWAKLNSRMVGGNPEDITVWGRREGAAAAALLITSPLVMNLLRKVVFESGSMHTSMDSLRRNSEAVTTRLLVNAGCYNYAIPWELQRDRAIRCLKTVHPEVIVGTFIL